MLLNQNMLTVAGGVMVALGSTAKLIPLPAECKAAIASQSTAQVSAVCGILASDAGLIFVIFIGAVILYVTTPMKDAVDHMLASFKKQ